METYPFIPDGELKVLIDLIPAAGRKMPALREAIAHRKWCLLANRVHIRLTERLQEEIDQYLRMSFDVGYGCWFIERIDTGIRAWLPIYRWEDVKGCPRLLDTSHYSEIRHLLNEGDMRRFDSPQAYLQHKRELAKKKQEQIERSQIDELRGRIDNMSNRQIEQFVATEKAIAAGERIRSYGDDAKFLNMVHDNQKKGKTAAIPSNRDAVNPHMRPGGYQRTQL